MILQLEYRNGEIRKVQLHPIFFTDTLATENGKQMVMTPEAKALSLAHYLGSYPYKIVISKGGDIYMRKINPANNPTEANTKLPYPDEKGLKKQLKNQFKNVPFKYHWKLGEVIPLKSANGRL